MGQRSRKIIPFARNLRKRPPRRIGDSPGKILCLVVVFTAAFTLAAAELLDADAILAGWLSGAASPSTSIVGRASVTDGDTLRIPGSVGAESVEGRGVRLAAGGESAGALELGDGALGAWAPAAVDGAGIEAGLLQE